MQKFKTRIVYYNNGKIISTNETNILVENVTQQKIDTALSVILAVHTQEPPYNAKANIYLGRRRVKTFWYSGNQEFEDPNKPDGPPVNEGYM